MRLGLIARAENTGLSVQTYEFYQHMHPVKTLLVDMSQGRGRTFRPGLYPDAQVVQGIPTVQALKSFLDGLDVVFSAETVYNNVLYELAWQLGVKVVLQPNYEFFDSTAAPTLWAAPTVWHWDDLPDPKQLLPVPIATERFRERPQPESATRFVHIVGRPAIHDRNGTADLIAALQHVQSPVHVVIKCQDPEYVPKLIRGRYVPRHVAIEVDWGDAANYWDNYTGDVLVMPRRFGGLCLPAQEALAAGMPVIMPAVSPNGWLPSDWLVPADQVGAFMAKRRIALHTVNHRALAAKIDQFATDEAFFAEGCTKAQQLAKEMSWDALKPEYERVLAALLAREVPAANG